MKTAVVLFVKDESHDILTWIIWHSLVGFDTFIICDDNSNDGTDFLVDVASDFYDVRFFQNEFKEISYFYYRQEAFYKMILEEFKNEFDWIGFFDADEYLLLDNEISLHSFLESFPTADAIAIHWALYGSSGHILSPRIPSVGAFTRHSTSTEPICTHIKSIVRPGKVGLNWKNVHAFDVQAYQNCDRKAFHWGHIPGVTLDRPTWINAKLMHFQLRSMEQFIERCKRRPDVHPDRTLFNTLDQNSVEDLRPHRCMPEIMSRLRQIVGEFPLRCSIGERAHRYSGDWAAFKLMTAHGDAVSVYNSALHASESGDEDVIALLSPIEGKCVLFDEASMQYFVYHASFDPVEKIVVLQDVDNLKFLTAVPRTHGGIVVSRGDTISFWERFNVKPLSGDYHSDFVKDFLAAFNSCSASDRILGSELFVSLLLEIAISTSNQNDIADSARIVRQRKVDVAPS